MVRAEIKVEPEVLWNEYKNNNLLNNEIPSEEIEPPPLSPVEDTCFARSCVDLCHQTVAATTNISVEDAKRCVQEILKTGEDQGISIDEA